MYHRASHAATLGRLHLPLDHQVPIACAGVTVMPGDIVVGDGEGVVVVPAALAVEVAADAYQQELEEEWALERVAAGESTIGVFPIAKDRRAEFEAWLAARPRRLTSDEETRRMPRRSIEIERFHHANPIPAAARVGPLLVSSVIAPATPAAEDSRRRGRAARQPLPPRRRDAGGRRRRLADIVKMSFYVPDLACARPSTAPGSSTSPTRRSRPARHTQLRRAAEAITCEFIAYVTTDCRPILSAQAERSWWRV